MSPLCMTNLVLRCPYCCLLNYRVLQEFIWETYLVQYHNIKEIAINSWRPFLIISFYNPYQNLIILYTSDRHSQVYLSGLYIFSLNEMKRRIISPLKQAVAARKRFRLFILSKNCMHKSRRAYSENKFRKHITCQEFAVLLFTLALDYLNLEYDQILMKIFCYFSNWLF